MKYSISGMMTAAFIALMPFVIWTQLFYSAVNGKFFFSILCINLFVLWGCYLILRGEVTLDVRRRYFLYTLVFALATQYVAAYFGVFFEKSLWSDILRSTGVLFLTHVVLLGVILSVILKTEDWSLVRRAVIISSAIFGAISIIGFYGLGLRGEFLFFKLTHQGLTFGNSTFAGVYLLVAFFFGLIEYVRSYADMRWRRIVLSALILVGLSPILFNTAILFGKAPLLEVFGNPLSLLGSARASSATMFVVVGFFMGRWIINLYVPKHAGRLVAVWGGLIIAGMSIAVALLLISGSPVQRAYVETATAARPLIWDSGFQAFLERPWFGWGPENFNDAFERHFKNDLYLEENIGEIWFDRAHNIVVDILVTTGVLGVCAHIVFVGGFMFVILRAYRKEIIGSAEAIILTAFLPAHFLQLQTGFDTVPSYVLLGVMAGYVLSLEARAGAHSLDTSQWHMMLGKVFAVLLIVGGLVSLKFVFYDELIRQRALMKTFNAPIEEQRELIKISLAQSSDWESLRLSASSFIKGSLEGAADANDRKTYVANVLETAKIYEERYQAYLMAHPDYYRARMNLTYLFMIETALGNYRLNEAKDLVESSYHLSPDNPLTHVLNALVFLYGINFDKAREHIEAAIAQNPDIEFPHEIQAYIEEQIKIFPRNRILQLQNL